MQLLNVQDDEVAHDQSLDLFDLILYTDSVAVYTYVGSEDGMQNCSKGKG